MNRGTRNICGGFSPCEAGQDYYHRGEWAQVPLWQTKRRHLTKLVARILPHRLVIHIGANTPA